MRLVSLRSVPRSSRRHRVTRFGVLVVALLGACSRPYDVVIENGRVVDGTGNPWMYGDVAIRGDRIVAVTPRGALSNAKAKLRIDAHGHVLAPGFIDIQNHSWDNVLWKDGRVPSMVTQGVTSVILGEATTPAPSNDKLEALEELAKMDSTRARLQRSFRGEHGFKQWLDAIGRHPNSVNAGSYLGAATVRAYAVGQSAAPPTPAQLDTMRAVVRNAMRDGAFGISSALIYPPGSYAGTAELIEDGEGDGAVPWRVHHAHALGGRLAARGDGRGVPHRA